jgi:hypothetical protein
MFIQYILNFLAFFGFEKNPLLCIEDKYTSPLLKNRIEREYENKGENLV